MRVIDITIDRYRSYVYLRCQDARDSFTLLSFVCKLGCHGSVFVENANALVSNGCSRALLVLRCTHNKNGMLLFAVAALKTPTRTGYNAPTQDTLRQRQRACKQWLHPPADRPKTHSSNGMLPMAAAVLKPSTRNGYNAPTQDTLR